MERIDIEMRSEHLIFGFEINTRLFLLLLLSTSILHTDINKHSTVFTFVTKYCF